jgi:hypothetical protein
MIPKAGYYTPLLHVNSIEESMRFYDLLGFETIDQMGELGRLGWARMHCEGGALMFLRAEEPHPLKKSSTCCSPCTRRTCLLFVNICWRVVFRHPRLLIPNICPAVRSRSLILTDTLSMSIIGVPMSTSNGKTNGKSG